MQIFFRINVFAFIPVYVFTDSYFHLLRKFFSFPCNAQITGVVKFNLLRVIS
jgi:hypothetical protein